MRTNRTVKNIIEHALVLSHTQEIENVLLYINDECEIAGIDAHWTCEIADTVKQKITDSKDFQAGVRDCKARVYDKWYRYNRKNDGAAYDKGWMQQNRTTQCEVVTFLNA